MFFFLFDICDGKMMEKDWKNMEKRKKRLFQPANGMQSTHLLVEIHNTLELKQQMPFLVED